MAVTKEEAAWLRAIAKRLRAARERRGYSYRKVAALAGVSVMHVYYAERGLRPHTSLLHLRRMAIALGISLAGLVSVTD